MDIPQTAAAINAPQTGKTSFVPSKTVPAKPIAKPFKRELPAGWWTVDSAHPGNKGMKELTVQKIETDPNIPAHWKAALVAEINSRNGQALETHAHAQDEQGNFTLTVHIKRLF